MSSTPRSRALDLIDDARELLLEAQQVLDTGDPDDSSDADVYRAIDKARAALGPLFEHATQRRPMGWRASVAALGKPPN